MCNFLYNFVCWTAGPKSFRANFFFELRQKSAVGLWKNFAMGANAPLCSILRLRLRSVLDGMHTDWLDHCSALTHPYTDDISPTATFWSTLLITGPAAGLKLLLNQQRRRGNLGSELRCTIYNIRKNVWCLILHGLLGEIHEQGHHQKSCGWGVCESKFCLCCRLSSCTKFFVRWAPAKYMRSCNVWVAFWFRSMGLEVYWWDRRGNPRCVGLLPNVILRVSPNPFKSW